MEHQLQMEDFHGFSIATFDCGSVTNSTKGKGWISTYFKVKISEPPPSYGNFPEENMMPTTWDGMGFQMLYVFDNGYF